LDVVDISYVGESKTATNPIAALLMDLAGNPYGTYDQEEPCLHCGKPLAPPPGRTILQRLSTRAAIYARRATEGFAPAHGNWIHMLFKKRAPEFVPQSS
jgi:hypothetical protein